jgi:hypothetical protein
VISSLRRKIDSSDIAVTVGGIHLRSDTRSGWRLALGLFYVSKAQTAVLAAGADYRSVV